VAFRIARAILTLTVRLIDRLAVDPGTRRTSPRVVCVDIIDTDDHPGIRHVDGKRRVEMMLGGHVVQPDRCITGTHFTMDRQTLRSSMNPSRHEPKRANQEIVCGWDVPVGEERNDSFEGWHQLLLDPATS